MPHKLVTKISFLSPFFCSVWSIRKRKNESLFIPQVCLLSFATKPYRRLNIKKHLWQFLFIILKQIQNKRTIFSPILKTILMVGAEDRRDHAFGTPNLETIYHKPFSWNKLKRWIKHRTKHVENSNLGCHK